MRIPQRMQAETETLAQWGSLAHAHLSLAGHRRQQRLAALAAREADSAAQSEARQSRIAEWFSLSAPRQLALLSVPCVITLGIATFCIYYIVIFGGFAKNATTWVWLQANLQSLAIALVVLDPLITYVMVLLCDRGLNGSEVRSCPLFVLMFLSIFVVFIAQQKGHSRRR